MAFRRSLVAVLGVVLSWQLCIAEAVLAQAPRRGAGDADLQLTLVEAMRIAFDNNLDIRVVEFDRSFSQEQVTTAKGRFEPVLHVGLPGASSVNPFPGGAAFGAGTGFGGLGFADVRSPASTALAGADTVTSSSFATLVDYQQTLRGGTRFDVSYNVGRANTNSIFQSLNPSWDNTLAVSVVQPLLSGRGREGSAAELLLAQANTLVSARAFRAQVEQILLEVERAYWELVFAERDLVVKEQSLSLAQEQLERTQAQVDVGLIAPVEVTQAEVQVASRQTELIVAGNGVDNLRDELRALLGADSLPSGWETRLTLLDEPEIVVTEVDLDAAIDDALERRGEIGRGRALIEARRVAVSASRNALLPRLDLIGQVSTNGIGGDLIVRDGFPGEVIDVIPGGYGDAVNQLVGLDFVSWRVGVNVTVPLGNSTAKGNYAQATIDEDRARTELERTRQQVVLEVRRAARDVVGAVDAARSARKTRELAERQLEIETDRFDVGMSTNFEVLRFQDDLAVVRSAELRAIIEHRLAVAGLERARGRLLEKYGIRLRDDAGATTEH